MESFTITKSADFGDIENFFRVLEENRNVELRIPNSLKNKGIMGLEGLVCQVIANWLRNNENKKILHTYIDNINHEEFESVSSNFYGICALRLSDSVISNSKKEEFSKEVYLVSAIERVKLIIKKEYASAYKGLYVAIHSIKSSGVNKEYNSPFYNGKKVIGERGFKNEVNKILDTVVPQRNRSIVLEDIKDRVAGIIRELFDNTDKHSRTDEYGNILPINFRGVIFNSADLSEARLLELSRSYLEGFPGMAAEWGAWITKNKRNCPVLDITVVDSGPGFARRWTGKSKENLTLDEEIDSVVNCFTEKNSSSPNLADGYGLTHVLKDLRKLRGWFRLRTGSVSVSRSYFNGQGTVIIEKNDIVKAGSFAEGVSFNIVIPLVSVD